LSAMISKSTTTTKGRRCSEGYLLCRLVALVSGLAALGPAAARAGEHDAEVVTTFRKGVLVMPYIGFAVPVGKVSARVTGKTPPVTLTVKFCAVPPEAREGGVGSVMVISGLITRLNVPGAA